MNRVKLPGKLKYKKILLAFLIVISIVILLKVRSENKSKQITNEVNINDELSIDSEQKEDEKLVRIFLYAPLEYRLNKVMEIYHDSHEDALRYIHKSDHSRKSYYEVISNKIWGDKSNYDLCLDCKLGNETIKDIICNYVKSLNK